jgi:hypothetical protein
MSRTRIASLCLIVALVFAPLPARAQGPSSSVAARIAALEARVAKLEGGITSADLVGTYALAWINIPLDGHTATQSASVKTDGVTGTLTLSAGGGASLVIAGCSVVLGIEPSWALTNLGCGGDSATGTWTYANGVLTTDIGQYDFDYNVGVGGRLLTAAGAFFHAGDASSDAGIIVGSRLQ